jgi:GNAT superfamily N-acetyltransferase
MGILIRAAEAGDLPVLNGIARAVKAHWGYPEEWMEAWRGSLTLTPDDLERWCVRVAVDSDAEVLGFCATSPGATRWIVEHLWVRPGELGRGVGRALVRDALERAREGGADGLEIESDPYAEGFYHRLVLQLHDIRLLLLETLGWVSPVRNLRIRISLCSESILISNADRPVLSANA